MTKSELLVLASQSSSWKRKHPPSTMPKMEDPITIASQQSRSEIRQNMIALRSVMSQGWLAYD